MAKKETTLSSLGKEARCLCGAETYDPEKRPHGAVGLIRYRKTKHAQDGGYSVGCTCCGRLGERGNTQADALSRWLAGRFKYGPLKEADA